MRENLKGVEDVASRLDDKKARSKCIIGKCRFRIGKEKNFRPYPGGYRATGKKRRKERGLI